MEKHQDNKNIRVQSELLDIAGALAHLGQMLATEADRAEGESQATLSRLASIAMITGRSAESLSEDVAGICA